MDQKLIVQRLKLIDTLWNVNKQEKTTCKQRRHELIDTLWNVNEEKDKLSNNERVRINRYIMECK